MAMLSCLLAGAAAFTVPAATVPSQVQYTVPVQYQSAGIMQASQPVQQQVVIVEGQENSAVFGATGWAVLLGAVSGFSLSALAVSGKSTPSEEPINRRDAIAKALGATAFLGAAAANADVDYAGVGYLGGSNLIDVNNANIRVYQKLPGMYPNAAGKIVTNAPYKSKEELYTKAKLSAKESEATKKYESRFIFLEPRPEYIIDNINNGLYR